MKRLLVALLIITELFLVLPVKNVNAACSVPNESTGLCDNPGYPVMCASGANYGACCETESDCNSIPHVGNDKFGCQWDGTHCVIAIQNCTGGKEPIPAFCLGFNANSCQGQVGDCTFPTVTNLPEVFCVSLDPDQRTSDPTKSGRIATAIGCVPVDTAQNMATFFLTWGIGLGGGIAFILIVIAGFMITSSAGDPRKIQSGKELLTAAIAGLVFLLATAFIMRVVGRDILQIPGL